MRAIQSSHRRKFAAGLVMTSVVALSILGGGLATAANSRTLYIGSDLVRSDGTIVDDLINATGQPGHDGIPDNAGKLLPTAVNAGFSTAVPVQLKSVDNQTIAHAVLTFPAGGAFTTASGLQITAVGGTNASACPTISDPVRSITCNFDNLPGFALRSLFFVVSTTNPIAPTVDAPVFKVQVTTNNENGSNLQLFTADSGTGFAIQPTSANGLSTFVKPAPGQLRQTFNTNGVAGTNKLQTKVDFDQSAGGNLVSIAETDNGSTNFLYTCPDGQSCQPVETTISITNDLSGSATEFGSPFLQVTLTALVPKTYTLSKAFVAHYGPSVTTPDWILFWNTKATKCGTDPATILATMPSCFQSATLTKPNSDGLETVTLTVLMKHNGGARF